MHAKADLECNMADETTTTIAPAAAQGSAPEGGDDRRGGPRGGGRGRGSGRGNRERTRRARPERARPEFDQKMIDIRRVARVTSGGRRFNFSVTLVIGNNRGTVGVGLGKGTDTQLAVEKALRDAKKHLVNVSLKDDMSIPHESRAKYAASDLVLMPAPGKGLKAGGAVRTVLQMAGIKHTSAKMLSRSKNSLNNARAALEALKKIKA